VGPVVTGQMVSQRITELRRERLLRKVARQKRKNIWRTKQLHKSTLRNTICGEFTSARYDESTY